jgi:hypothetical protein
LKNENYELCFSAGSFIDQIMTGKKGTVIWPSVGMFGGSMSLDYFDGFLDQTTTGKKGTVVWPSVAMSDCFGGFVAMFFGRFLDQITNIDWKKRYSCLAIGWNVTSKTCLTMVEPFAGPSSMAMGNQPMPSRYPLCKRFSEGGVRGFMLTL